MCAPPHGVDFSDLRDHRTLLLLGVTGLLVSPKDQKRRSGSAETSCQDCVPAVWGCWASTRSSGRIGTWETGCSDHPCPLGRTWRALWGCQC